MKDTNVDPTLCAAYGCPCKGSMTSSTGGTDKWYCAHHFGRDAISWQKITAELNRLGFIAEALQNINEHAGKDDWPEVYRGIQQQLQVNTRNDLLRNKTESLSAWYQRLDAELHNACKGSKPAPELELKTVPTAEINHFQRVTLSVPEHA